MRAAQIADLRTIANHCDGVRCDMAMLQLNDIFKPTGATSWVTRPGHEKEFWTEAHAAVANLTLLAEAYWGTEQRLLDLGFSFSYDKTLYDASATTTSRKSASASRASPNVKAISRASWKITTNSAAP